MYGVEDTVVKMMEKWPFWSLIIVCMCVCVCMCVAQSCLTFCKPNYSGGHKIKM